MEDTGVKWKVVSSEEVNTEKNQDAKAQGNRNLDIAQLSSNILMDRQAGRIGLKLQVILIQKWGGRGKVPAPQLSP